MVIVRHLQWEEWNEDHIARHGITRDDVEEVCHGNPAEDDTYDDRLRLVGPNAVGNLLTIILAPKPGPGVYYVVTARPAAKKERRLYRERMGEG